MVGTWPTDGVANRRTVGLPISSDVNWYIPIRCSEFCADTLVGCDSYGFPPEEIQVTREPATRGQQADMANEAVAERRANSRYRDAVGFGAGSYRPTVRCFFACRLSVPCLGAFRSGGGT